MAITYGKVEQLDQKFTRKERDNETNLDFFEARYFSSTQGRFTRPDPILSSAIPTNPQTWNRYTYCINNPLAYVDPTGMWNWSAALGGNRTDEQLREQLKQIGQDETLSPDERDQQSADIVSILGQRQEFRDALTLANSVLEHADLSFEEKLAGSFVLSTYGTENDGNGTIVALSTNTTGAAFTREENGKRIVAFTASELNNSGLWTSVFHEGVHLFQSVARGIVGGNLSIARAESEAYSAEASLVAGIDRTSVNANRASQGPGAFSVGHPPIVLWQRGWTEADMKNGLDQHLRRLGYLDGNGNETTRGARPAFPGGGAGQWQ